MKKIFPFVLIIFYFMAIHSCRHKTDADLILHHATFYIVDTAFSKADAMVVTDGRVVETGNYQELLKRYKAKDEIDLDGAFVYPGFIDAHCHLYGLALSMQQADLRGAESFDEVLRRLKNHYDLYHPQWLCGRGWDQNLWKYKNFPDNVLIDSMFPDVPVVLTRIDGHAVLAGSKALELCGITATSEISGGYISLKNGKPDGILLDKAADLVKSRVPDPQGEELTALLLRAQQHCLSKGLTSVADAGLPYHIIQLYDSLQKAGQMLIHVYAMLDPDEENISRFLKKGIYNSGRLHICSIKIYSDGALGSRGACLIDDYSDLKGHKGMIVEDAEKIELLCKLAYEYNYQVCTHCIGDSANRMMLNIYASVLGGKNDRRWRIEHAQVVHPDDFCMFGNYSVIPSVQPVHATSDMYWAKERLGDVRILNAYAYRKLLEQNSWIAFGTDFPIELADPLLTFYAAIARKDVKGFPENGFLPENAVGREDALRAMTIWAAKACFEENERGSLEAGKQADFIVLRHDLMKVCPDSIPGMQVMATYIDGKAVFSINN